MAVLCVHGVLCILGTALMILPHVNLGLLSDYKICGDSACESMISSAQAIKDHQGKDCRFLSFRRGDTIFVYHKLTGKREDLWAGSIDKQFGYFPKDAVQEEQVYAAMEKVVETRKSDFFCMDEFGYPTDSTHLDSDDDAADDETDKEIQMHESEFTQSSTHTESSLESAGPDPTEPTVSAQEAGGNEEKNNVDPAEDTQNTASMDEQGGSPSSAWLDSSVTGWLGLNKEELPDHLAEEQKDQENKDTQAGDSLASTVTSWLTFSREGKPGNGEESVETGEETADSVTSSIGGWLGFSKEKKTDSAKEEKEEPVEKFRSRKFSLDLEGSQLHSEEEKDTGTFGWLRDGLTNTLGFDSSNKESSDDTSAVQTEKDEKEPPSSSWLEIGGILGFKNEKNGDEIDHTENSLKETRNDEDTAGLEANVVTSQSQLALTDDVKIDKSNLEEPPKDQNANSNTQNGDEQIKESLEKEQDKNNEVTSVETKDEDQEQNNETMEQKQEEIQIPIGSNLDTTTQDDIHLSPDHTSGSSIGEGKAEDENNPMSVETGSDDDDREVAGSNEEATSPQEEMLSTQTGELADESQISSEQSQLSSLFSSGESRDPVQAGNSSFISRGEETKEDDTNTEAGIDVNGEPETSYNGSAQEKETPSAAGSAQEVTLLNFTGGDAESLMENSSEVEKVSLDDNTPSAKSDIEGGNDTSDGGKQELMKEEGDRKLDESIQVEEIPVNQEEEEQSEEEKRSDNPDDSREAEELKEVEKQDKVELVEDGNVKLEELMMVEEIKKEEVKVLEGGEGNDQLPDLKEAEEIKEERQEVEGLDEEVEQKRRDDTNEETALEGTKENENNGEDSNIKEQIITSNHLPDLKEAEEIKEESQEVEGLDEKEEQQRRDDVHKETVLEEIKEKENNGEDNNTKEQIITLNPNEENENKDVAELTQKNGNAELTDSKEEKTVGETEVVKEEEKADEGALKEVDEIKELAKEETDEKQVKFEVEHNPGDSGTPAPGRSKESIQDKSFTPSFAESFPNTESPQPEERWEDEDKKGEEVAELEPGDILKCSKELCPEGSTEEFVVKDVGISGSREMTEKLNNHTNRTSERELSPSAGETEHTGGFGTMEGEIEEEIREEMNQEEEEQSEDEERSGKPHDSSEVKEKVEVEKQDKVEELVDEEDLVVVEVIRNETPEEAKGDEENEQPGDSIEVEEIKEEGRQEVEGGDESKKMRDGMKEKMEIEEKENNEGDETVKEKRSEEENKELSKNERRDSRSKEKREISPSTSDGEQPASLGSSLTADDHSRGSATGGAFGLFKNAFGFFSQTPTTETVDSPEQARTPNLNDIDPSELQSTLIHKQDLDPAGEASRNQNESPESSPGPLPPSTNLHTPFPNPEAPQQTKALTKHYKNLLIHVDPEEMAILLDLFGQHKLQFLDYALSSSEAEDPDGDQSIVSDMERLLEHHREKLVSPSMRIAEASQEDKDRSRTLVALQKLEVMLESVRKSFQSDVSIHQGNEDNVMDKDEFTLTDEDHGRERDSVKDKTEANRADIHSQLQEGGMSQFLDFIRQMAEGSVTYSRALMELFSQYSKYLK